MAGALVLGAGAGCAPRPQEISIRTLERMYPEHVQWNAHNARMALRMQRCPVAHVPQVFAWRPPLSPCAQGGIRGLASQRSHRAKFILDTGGAFLVTLSPRGAARFDVPIVPAVHARRARVVGGVQVAEIGVAAIVEVPPVRIEPVAVSIAGRVAPLLGQLYVDKLGGFVLDPCHQRIILIPQITADIARANIARRGAAAGDSGWIELPWRACGDGILRSTPVQLAGRSVEAVLDTGAQKASVFLFEHVAQVAPTTDASARTVSAWGSPVRIVEGRLQGALVLGPIRVEEPVVHYRADSDRTSDPSPRSADIIVGMKILSKAPIWFDPGTDTVRIWTGASCPCGELLGLDYGQEHWVELPCLPDTRGVVRDP